jgi:hypothetical protein
MPQKGTTVNIMEKMLQTRMTFTADIDRADYIINSSKKDHLSEIR